MRPKDIIADMKTMYGIQIKYSKAHQALDYALSLTYGTHEESFQLMPSFGYVLEQQNPGTITDLQCDENVKIKLPISTYLPIKLNANTGIPCGGTSSSGSKLNLPHSLRRWLRFASVHTSEIWTFTV
ncbi:hypothetical protein Ddye_005222 [Dipteronia dyeriana]|uniref:Uncharacterized protein n=1 Tax=Dipteronia dyeriana TaxID=168575 RepID=A0AAE0CPJ5_9ROSI|nr:hypothetical protein Ddye_005222 [Dipteronia dyeriana]